MYWSILEGLFWSILEKTQFDEFGLSNHWNWQIETGDENLRLGSKKCTNMVIIRFFSSFWLDMVTTRYFSFILNLYEAIQTICIGWMALLFQIVKHLHNKILINFFLLDLSVLLILPTSSLHKLSFFFKICKFYIFVVIPVNGSP